MEGETADADVDLIRAFQAANPGDRQDVGHAGSEPAVRDDRDARLPRLRVQPLLLPHDVGVPAQVAEGDPRVDRGARQERIQEIGHGRDDDRVAGQAVREASFIGHVDRLGAHRRGAPLQTLRHASGALRVDVGDDDFRDVRRAGKIERGGEALLAGSQYQESHRNDPPIGSASRG
jgi:hypothetical protein